MADSIRVLIADDDPLVRVGLSLVLGAAPEVEIVGEAGDGAEAIEMVRSLRPDVVLMDIRMPRMDGLAATETLRRDGPDPAIIVLTTFDTDENLLSALRLGANGFLLKDIAPTEILNAVRRAAAGESILAPAVVPRLIDYAVGRAGAAGDNGTSPSGKLNPDGDASGTHARADELSIAAQGSGTRADEQASDTPDRAVGALDRATGVPDRAAAERRERASVVLRRLSARERDVAEAVATGRSNAEIGADLHMSVPTVKAYVSRILDKLGCANRVQIAILIHEAR
jgi:DNA-binding NarL/FixJ family response regulator